MNKDPFKEYIKQSEPNKRDKGYAWHTAIGLQAVDGLKTSKYLIDIAIKNIEGDISIDEAQELLNTYYEENPKADTEDRTEEADKVAVRIAKILSEKAFSFTPNEYISIHKKLFTGIYGHAGKLRDYNITKKEWVLNGASVLYGSASELQATLDYDFSEEKKFSYKNLSMEEIIHHLAIFVSRLWQIHVFGEGNTRTTAVFFIKYLRTLGFDATNDIFAENAWYFRNALVRSNYNDLKNGIHETTEYLELFLRNLLLDEKNELHNRSMHISGMFKEVDIEGAKVDIESEEVDIENAEKPERSNKKKERPITLLDILQEQKASKYSGGIYHKTQIDLTYNSNHIEGSRLTHDQTRYIFETNTIGVENEVLNVDDVIETANHFRCIDMIIE
ncbi:MAG: Fic family protein, partial [Lachnospira sp.]|nr:Fic family protein [Lachnospira sp.]